MVGFQKFILINAYMPCDSQNVVLNDEYKEMLYDVESVIVLHHEIDHVIIGGDLNTDISRVGSVHSAMLEEFYARLSLRFCLSFPKNSVCFTYNEATGAQFVLDHFIVSENLFGSIESYSCLHEGDNLSDHLPVCLNLDVKASFAPQSNAYALNRSSWQRATFQDKAAYQMRLKELLREDMAFEREAQNRVGPGHSKKDESPIQAYFKALSENNSRDLWGEVKKLKGGSYAQPRVVDEIEGAKLYSYIFHGGNASFNANTLVSICAKLSLTSSPIAAAATHPRSLCMLGAPLSSLVQDQWKRSVSDGEAALASAVAELRDVVRGHSSSILSIAEARRLLLEVCLSKV
ncbi:hypothetical protein CAPTEDRAFT_190376 [Capitella teleta]|uniref:Endonuclease/exonuclease/phosphatase domain-containing protein n=1 Tax=Capitella teleta TaxID=283909 RepID=R7VM30_CAPTE|nr:hypothetical protein CAPTEDRAFT_190376 [Capitella teleta]|eukprot:ELU18135.1 hypothetical protein CAPTEDRAFT_190376 [Capitella teleta]